MRTSISTSIFLFAFMLISCNNNNEYWDNDYLLNNISDCVDSFWENNDSSLLYIGLQLADSGIRNYSEKENFIIEKVRILRILNQYDNAISFVELLPDSLFSYKYKKKYLNNITKSIQADKNKDTNESKKIIIETVNYIESQNISIINNDYPSIFVLLDYYLIRSLYEPTTLLIEEIKNREIDDDSKEFIIVNTENLDKVKYYGGQISSLQR